MPRFDEYLAQLQRWSGLEPIELIRPWTEKEIADVEATIRTAIARSQIIGAVIPDFEGTSQAKGNKVEHFVFERLQEHLPPNYNLVDAEGGGYPDRLFIAGSIGHCMEFKATSNWQDGDSNRRVLTSSPTKLIGLVKGQKVGEAPNYLPAHLICTAIYNDEHSSLQGLRLDFLEPCSEVKVRLEASTSQRLLTKEKHSKFSFT